MKAAVIVCFLLQTVYAHPTSSFVEFVTAKPVFKEHKPLPAFLKEVTPEERSEYFKLRANESLSPLEYKTVLAEWAQKQGADVKEAVISTQNELSAQRLAVRRQVVTLMSQLPQFFERLHNVASVETLSRKELKMNIAELFRSSDEVTSTAARFILQMFRDIETDNEAGKGSLKTVYGSEKVEKGDGRFVKSSASSSSSSEAQTSEEEIATTKTIVEETSTQSSEQWQIEVITELD